MKEIDLAMKPENMEVSPGKPSNKKYYPSFTMHDDVDDDVMKFPIGKELTAKIKVTSKTIHEGTNKSKSIGFDVISIITDDKKESAREKGKKLIKDVFGDKD